MLPSAAARSAVLSALLLGLAGLACTGCEGRNDPSSDDRRESETTRLQADPPAADDAPFTEITQEVGLDFVHFNGMSGGYYYSEMMGSGGALFDADGDGDLDLFLVQGAELAGVAAAESLSPPPESMLPLRDRLYRNDLGAEGLIFEDVTEASGLDSRGYGMGVAAADFDGDGHVDLYVTRHGANAHWRNRGDGTFEDVTDEVSRLDGWSVPAVPFDVDGDGDLDLFVGRYVRYSTDDDRSCTDELGQRNYCGPLAYPSVPDRLLLNRGDGTFERASAFDAALESAYGPALGALATDLTGDGRLELFVANDGSENQLWSWNDGGLEEGGLEDGGLEDIALLAGVSVNGRGQAEASMGVDAADLWSNGSEDLFVTHLSGETNTLYVGRGGGEAFAGLVDRSAESGLGAPSFDRTGFGTRFVDWDLDGDLDVAVVNGAVKVIKELALAGDPYPLHQRNQLFENVGGYGTSSEPGSDRAGRLAFEEIPPGAWGEASEVSRGAIFGDLDQDGDADAVVTNNAGPARIFRNVAGDGKAWLGVELLEPSRGERPTPALHALAEITVGGVGRDAETEGETQRLRLRVQTSAGYASSQDPRLVFGLGLESHDAAYEVRVRWADGSEERFRGLGSHRYHRLIRGQGVAPR